MKKISYYDLEIGMKLAKDLYFPSTYNLLVRKGTVVSPELLSKLTELKLFDIYIEDPQEEERYKQAQVLYSQAHREILEVFEKIRTEGIVNITPVERCVRNFIKHILAKDVFLTHLTMIKSIDNYTATHSINVCIYSLLLGQLLGWNREKLLNLGIGALLHDVGKVYVPEAILNKPAKLTESEFNIIKRHPAFGKLTLAKNEDIHPAVLRMVYEHHERLDGSGYPEGKKATELITESKIIAVADVFDAVTTERVYRRAMPPHEGIEVLMGWGSVKRLDPLLVQIFLENMTIYPLGTLVELTNGEVGKVIHIPRSLPTRPTIQLCSTGEIVSLLENTTLFIKNIILPTTAKGNSYGPN